MRTDSIRYLIVPGWQGSPDDHWQTHWQNSLPNCERVEQADWATPRRQDWVAALGAAVDAADTPTILVAHSLGCVTVAHWARQAPRTSLAKVAGALLVAPADVERENCPPALRNFGPIPRDLLPFPSQVVTSDNDPAISAHRAVQLAGDWGAQVAVVEGAGHINVTSGHRRWEQGFGFLYRLQNRLHRGALRTA